MFKKLKRKLTYFYVSITGLIITLALAIIFINIYIENENGLMLSFKNNMWMIKSNIKDSDNISYSWIASMESENNLIILLEDNDIPIQYMHSAEDKKDIEDIKKKLSERALKDNVNTELMPISKSEIQSDSYKIDADNGNKYIGSIYIFSIAENKRVLYLFQDITQTEGGMFLQGVMFAFIDVVAIALFVIVTRVMVKKSLQPVEESKRKQDRFIASASHELKSPLAVIRANSSAISVEPENSVKYARIIDKECERAGRLIADLLLLANANADGMKVNFEKINPEEILIEEYDAFSNVCCEKGSNLDIDFVNEEYPEINADRDRIKQVLSIFIDNALSYSPAGEKILLRAYVKKNEMCFEVEDHGCGIPDDAKKAVFECFYRQDKAHKDKNHYGLGLSIANEITRIHGGKIVIYDTEGGGATFCLKLPVNNG